MVTRQSRVIDRDEIYRRVASQRMPVGLIKEIRTPVAGADTSGRTIESIRR